MKVLALPIAKNIPAKDYQLNLHLIPFFNETPLNKITSFDIERFKKSRHDNKAKPGTINRELATLSHLFSKALEWQWLDKKPAIIKRYKEDGSRITYLTVEQIDRLLVAAKQDPHPQIYLFIIIGLETAMRRMEILSIKLEDVDLDRRIINIPKAKAGARQQPITSHLADVLKFHVGNNKKNQTWLFPAINSASGHTMNIEKPFRRVVENAGFDPKQIVKNI